MSSFRNHGGIIILSIANMNKTGRRVVGQSGPWGWLNSRAGVVRVADLGAATKLKVCFLGLYRSGSASERTVWHPRRTASQAMKRSSKYQAIIGATTAFGINPADSEEPEAQARSLKKKRLQGAFSTLTAQPMLRTAITMAPQLATVMAAFSPFRIGRPKLPRSGTLTTTNTWNILQPY